MQRVIAQLFSRRAAGIAITAATMIAIVVPPASALETTESSPRGRQVGVVPTPTQPTKPVIATPPPPPPPPPAPPVVASIGDSYGSGEGAPGGSRSFAGTWRHPGDKWDSDWDLNDNETEDCHRSPLAGSTQLATFMRELYPRTMHVSVACSGAEITDSTRRDWLGTLLDGNGSPEVQSQLEELHARLSALGISNVDALTVSIGGNDLGFASILKECIALGALDWMDVDGGYFDLVTCLNDPTLYMRLNNDFAALPGKYDELIGAIADPNQVGATVDDVYITLYPKVGRDEWGLPCNASPITDPVVSQLSLRHVLWAESSIIDPLNEQIRHAVDRANLIVPGPRWHVVESHLPQFERGGWCALHRMVNTFWDSVTTQQDTQGTMHPNDFGQRAIRDGLMVSMMTPIMEEQEGEAVVDAYSWDDIGDGHIINSAAWLGKSSGHLTGHTSVRCTNVLYGFKGRVIVVLRDVNGNTIHEHDAGTWGADSPTIFFSTSEQASIMWSADIDPALAQQADSIAIRHEWA